MKDIWNFVLESKDKLWRKAWGAKDKWKHF